MHENSDRAMAQATDAPPSPATAPEGLIRTIQEYLSSAVRCARSSEFPVPDESLGTTIEDISQEFSSAGGRIRVDPLPEADSRIELWLPPASGGPD